MKGVKLVQVALATLAWCTAKKLSNMHYDSRPRGAGKILPSPLATLVPCQGSSSNRCLHLHPTTHRRRSTMRSTLTLVSQTHGAMYARRGIVETLLSSERAFGYRLARVDRIPFRSHVQGTAEGRLNFPRGISFIVLAPSPLYPVYRG